MDEDQLGEETVLPDMTTYPSPVQGPVWLPVWLWLAKQWRVPGSVFAASLLANSMICVTSLVMTPGGKEVSLSF